MYITGIYFIYTYSINGLI